jgi:hypothetical protein
MVSYWATEDNQTLSQWTTDNSAQMNSMLGSTATGSTLAQLTAQLQGNGASLQLSSVNNMSSLLSSVSSASSTLDGQATTGGMNLAQSLASLYSSSAAKPSSDSAIFGLFYDQSLTNALKTSPNIFSKVSASLNSTSQAAWDSALGAAASSTGQSLSSLPDPCLVGMLTAMGTGTATGVAGLGGNSCGACDVAGTYLNASVQKILDPASNNLLTSSNGGVSTSAWTQLQGWLKSGTEAQNPDLTTTTNPAETANLASCGASSSAAQGALTKTLPGVFSNLGG